MTEIRMPQVGMLYPHVSGRGFVKLHVGMNQMVAARIMGDRYDVGFLTDLMPVEEFWRLVA